MRLPVPRHLPPLLLLGTLLLGAACSDRTEPPPAGPRAAAPDVSFRTLDGERLRLHDAAGPVLVSFWSTSCTVCLAEMPALATLRADYAPRGFELVAVAMPHDAPNAVLELAESRALPFPIALDIDGTVLAAFELADGPIAGTPTAFLVDGEGRIVRRHTGPADIPALRDLLDTLLDAAPLAAGARSTRVRELSARG